MMEQKYALRAEAEQMIRETGERVTENRLAVLECLLGSERPLSHHELADSFRTRGRGIDRVTLYRVLEWLSHRGLVHRVTGEDRLWRFSAGQPAPSHPHPHFHCEQCDRVFCLEEVDMPRISVPRGYQATTVDLMVRGFCPACKA